MTARIIAPLMPGLFIYSNEPETTWTLERKIEDGSDGFTALDGGDKFGTSVSLDGDRLAVGAKYDDGKNNSTTNAGAVYIFKRTGTTWALERKIEDGSAGFTALGSGDEFGHSVSLDGDRLAVGAICDDGKNNITYDAGAVYIFKRTGTTWALERKIEDGSDGFTALDGGRRAPWPRGRPLWMERLLRR